MKVGIIDYGAGNLQSVRNALHALDIDPIWVRGAEDLAALEVVILPGQGEFAGCVRNLQERGLWGPLREWILGGKPYFGICLGYQILFEGSEEEAGVPGLGIFRGQVVKFPEEKGLKIPHMGWNGLEVTDAGSGLWEGLLKREEGRGKGEMGGAGEKGDWGVPYAYFVHSYYPVPAEEEVARGIVACWTEYGGVRFASAVSSGSMRLHPDAAAPGAARVRRDQPNVSSGGGVDGERGLRLVATQFHPEKSQAVGLGILENFLRAVRVR